MARSESGPTERCISQLFGVAISGKNASFSKGLFTDFQRRLAQGGRTRCAALILNLIKISTEGAILNTDVIIKTALETFMVRASSLLFRAKVLHRRAMSKVGGKPPESYPKLSRLITPLGEIAPSMNENMSPELVWSTPFLGAIEKAGLGHLLKPISAPQGAGPSSPECFSNQHTPPELANQHPSIPSGNRGLRRSVAFQPSRIRAETVPPTK